MHEEESRRQRAAQVSEEATEAGEPFGYAGVFDGHGACASFLYVFFGVSAEVKTTVIAATPRVCRRRGHRLLAGG